MDGDEFRIAANQLIEFIIRYKTRSGKSQAKYKVRHGYLKELISITPPETGVSWDVIYKEIETKIVPGLLNWQHPRFHAFFPLGNGYPSILGDLLDSGLGVNGFSWATSPAATELETLMMVWLGNAMNLGDALIPRLHKQTPDSHNNSGGNQSTNSSYLNEQRRCSYNLNSLGYAQTVYDDHIDVREKDFYRHATPFLKCRTTELESNKYSSGGVLLGSATECLLVSLLCAKHRKIDSLKSYTTNFGNKLIAYASRLSHTSFEKVCKILGIKYRLIQFNTDTNSMNTKTLEGVIINDTKSGYIPFYVCATAGTTTCTSFDDISIIADICEQHQLYLHCDAAYAGNAMICSELRYLFAGIQRVDSLNINTCKWMLTSVDCACFWVRNVGLVYRSLSTTGDYLKYETLVHDVINYRHWGISFSRKFRSLKLWLTIRSYGLEGLRANIRNHIKLAKVFETQLLLDDRFKIRNKVVLGLVCFSLNNDVYTEQLIALLADDSTLYVRGSKLDSTTIIRFCINYENTKHSDVINAVNTIKKLTDKLYRINNR